MLVVFQDPADTRLNFIAVQQGATAHFIDANSNPSDSIITGFTTANVPDRAIVLNIVADGQPFPEDMTINGSDFGDGDPFGGFQGAYWDNRIDDITSLIGSGATSVDTSIVSNDDCLAWEVNALEIDNVGTQPPVVKRPPPHAPLVVGPRPAGKKPAWSMLAPGGKFGHATR